jgi:hypothetical protein
MSRQSRRNDATFHPLSQNFLASREQFILRQSARINIREDGAVHLVLPVFHTRLALQHATRFAAFHTKQHEVSEKKPVRDWIEDADELIAVGGDANPRIAGSARHDAPLRTVGTPRGEVSAACSWFDEVFPAFYPRVKRRATEQKTRYGAAECSSNDAWLASRRWC